MKSRAGKHSRTHPVDEDDGVGAAQELQLVRDEDARAAAQVAEDAALEEVPRHAWVHRAQRVVQEVEVGAPVDGPRQVDARALPARERGAAVAHHRLVATRELLKVVAQRAHLRHLRVEVTLSFFRGID